jgi:hypothetical protein
MPPKKNAKAKKSKPRKPQPLPRSVQALLKYLGGSDVKLGGARGGQPATLAPTSINIAVSQQQAQQQAQQQQFVQHRVAPKGQIIGQSPLTSVISQQPIILGLPQRRSDVEENEKKIETQKDELNKRLGVIETSQREILQIANEAYPNVNRRRNIGDTNIFDGEIVATRGKRPQVEEQQFAGVQVGEVEVEGMTVTDITDQGIYQAGQYLANVTNPEMTAIERAKRGRKPLTAEIKAAREREARIAKESIKEIRASVRAEKAESKKKPKATDIASLLEENVTTANVMKGLTGSKQRAPSPPNIIRRFTGPPPKKTVSTSGAPDMATQIALLTGGGAPLPPQSQGKTIAELLGASRK